MVWPWFFCGTVLSVNCLFIATTSWYSWFLLLFVSRFAFDVGQSAKICQIRDCVSCEVIAICSAFSGWSANQQITSLLATPCWRDPTRSNQLSTVAILGFQLELYHVVVTSLALSLRFSSVYFWLIRYSTENRQHFRSQSLAPLYLDLLRLDTLKNTKTAFIISKRYDEDPRPFYIESPCSPGDIGKLPLLRGGHFGT